MKKYYSQEELKKKVKRVENLNRDPTPEDKKKKKKKAYLVPT
ncbi:hypothetical protein [Anaerobiospirillum sp. NML120449]|nr:hypothetical protein [Anaerobiospirillum sp. NML120449]